MVEIRNVIQREIVVEVFSHGSALNRMITQSREIYKFFRQAHKAAVINRYFFSKATRETSLFTHLPFDYSNARFFRIVSCRLWTCPITRTGFCVPPPRITTGEYRSHYAAVSRNLHVTFSCIFPRDLSAGTFKLLTKKKEEK